MDDKIKKQHVRSVRSEIKAKTKSVLENRKHSNNIIDIIAFAESDDAEFILASISSLCKIFSRLMKNGEMFLERRPVDNVDFQDLSKECQYTVWLQERYSDVIDRLLELLHHDNTKVQESSLSILMQLVSAEGKHPIRKTSKKELSFPSQFLQRVIKQLCSEERDIRHLVGRLQEYFEFDDVKFYAMKFLLQDIKEKQKHNASEVFLNNVFALLENMSFVKTDEDRLTNFLSKPPDADFKDKVNSKKEHKKLFTSLWLEFLRFKLPAGLYKRILLIMHDKVMPHLTTPLMLSDFLTDSYNIGGAVSLLALNGLFILVHHYNLEYPDFYKKLYALFEPDIFHVKYRARFFHMSDLFLSSSHLPVYLVAAFIKRLARISLTAPPQGLLISLPFIYNLIHRHPNCKVLVNRPEAMDAIEEDPYLEEETDPSKCNALSSSLWEIKSLQSHFYPDVAMYARRIEHPLKAEEIDLSEVLDTTADDLMEREMKRKKIKVHMNHEPPTGLIRKQDTLMDSLWILD